MATSEKGISLLCARFCTAIRFLTIVPVSWRAEDDPQQFNKCLPFFPVVGALIGVVGHLGAYIFQFIFPQQVVAVLALVYLAFISGFLHLDGLADSADGLLSSRPREDCLNIMKDSRSGAMGVVVVVCLMLAKYSALSSMDPEKLCLAIFFMPLAGRSAILFSMARLPYAKPEGGLGRLFYSDSSKTAALAAFLSLLFLFAVLAPSQLIVALIAIMAVNLLFGRWCRRLLGGATGDTLGAVCELTEAITAIAFTASFLFL
ncbi:MAG: adenosylcobinamide-GDP ribazoletransferase [Desulforhopalus sp.]|nr:adenosylcobinamide-GDP ribazoletransferase [Desulforhopalus sp.]